MSGYNSAYDTDSYRLPEGFKRCGYDADTQEYFFTSSDGTTYKSLPGNTYGKLIPVSTTYSRPISNSIDDDDDFKNPFDEEPVADDVGNKQAWRSMLPFFVLVGLTLLFFINASSGWPRSLFRGGSKSASGGGRVGVECDNGSITHIIQAGETCWGLSKDYQTSIDILKNLNENLDCTNLKVGRQICVPVANMN